MVIKRDNRTVKFDKMKIVDAVLAAFKQIDNDISDYALIKAGNIADYISDIAKTKDLTVEEIQDLVEKGLMSTKRKDVAKAFIVYRDERTHLREMKGTLKFKNEKILNLIDGTDKESKTENSNKDTRIIPTMRDYIAGFTCKELAEFHIDRDILDAHNKGWIHFHDMDYSPAMPMTNCCLVNLEDMLQNGTVISGSKIDPPNSFRTACTVTTQIAAQVASSQYGGQTLNIAHLAPFVQKSRERYLRKFSFLNNSEIEKMVKDEISDGVQTIQYQLITMSSTNGQAPFASLFLYLKDAKNKQEEKDLALIIEEILKQRIKGVKNEQGVYVTVAFPKLLYVLDENNITEDSKYWYLTKLAAKCSAKRLVPDYISAKKMKELKGDVYGCMGCRSFLAGDPIEHRYWGKFNQGVVTINLAAAALEAINSKEDFWNVLDKRLELCYRALMIRHNRLLGTKSDVAPILWQHGACARLKPGEVIDPLLYGLNSSISLGYAGLWETVLALTNKSLTTSEGRDMALSIMKHLNEKCKEWKNKTNIGFSLYGTPIENTTTKFAKALKGYPIIKGVNDKLYVTNSYHINPAFSIDAFEKLTIESDFAKYSEGGQITYCETPNMENNIPALLEIIRHIYETNMYAEINTTTSYCQVCGSTDIKMDKKKLKFVCPCCGNDDFDKMNVAVRICGYISTNPFSEGRAADIAARVYHIDPEEEE